MQLKSTTFAMLALVLALAQIETAFSIPAFARKYNLSCSTCHAPAPRLNAFGGEFAGNGFVMKDNEPKRATLDTGDEMLLLQRELPLAVRLDAYAQFIPGAKGDDVEDDLQTPYLIKLLSGGRVSKSVSYYFYFFFSERGEVAGVEDAYLHFNDLFGAPFDIMAGQFQVSDPLFKRELRLSFEDYQIYRVQVGDVPSNLTYDRGLMLTYTAPWGSDFVGQILNGNGIGAARENRQFDGDKFKNFALRWTHEVSVLRLGLFGMYGKSEDRSTRNANQLWYAGPDATLTLGPFELNAQYLWRSDDNPYYASPKPGEQVETKGGFGELIFTPRGASSRWYLIGLYNKVTSNIQKIAPESSPVEYESAGFTATYLLARNLRLVGEYNYDFEGERNRIILGAVAGF